MKNNLPSDMPEPKFDEEGNKKFIEHLKTIKTKPNRNLQRFKLYMDKPNPNN